MNANIHTNCSNIKNFENEIRLKLIRITSNYQYNFSKLLLIFKCSNFTLKI